MFGSMWLKRHFDFKNFYHCEGCYNLLCLVMHVLDDANTSASQVLWIKCTNKWSRGICVLGKGIGWADMEFLHWLSIMLTHVNKIHRKCVQHFVLFKFPFLIARRHSRQCISEGLLHFSGGWSHSPFSLVPLNTPEASNNPQLGTACLILLLNYYTYLMVLRTLSAVEKR